MCGNAVCASSLGLGLLLTSHLPSQAGTCCSGSIVALPSHYARRKMNVVTELVDVRKMKMDGDTVIIL